MSRGEGAKGDEGAVEGGGGAPGMAKLHAENASLKEEIRQLRQQNGEKRANFALDQYAQGGQALLVRLTWIEEVSNLSGHEGGTQDDPQRQYRVHDYDHIIYDFRVDRSNVQAVLQNTGGAAASAAAGHGVLTPAPATSAADAETPLAQPVSETSDTKMLQLLGLHLRKLLFFRLPVEDARISDTGLKNGANIGGGLKEYTQALIKDTSPLHVFMQALGCGLCSAHHTEQSWHSYSKAHKHAYLSAFSAVNCLRHAMRAPGRNRPPNPL